MLSALFTQNREAVSGTSFPLSEVRLHRRLGHSTMWRLTVHLLGENRSTRESSTLANLLETGPLYVRPYWQESPLGIAGIVVGLAYADAARTLLHVEATATWAEQVEPDPYLPRRRVHRVEDVQKLLDIFAPVVQVSNTVRHECQRIKFADGMHASVIQDDLSDWAFVQYVLRQYYALQPEPRRKPLVMTGSLHPSPTYRGHWLLNWGATDAYDMAHDKAERVVDLASLGGYEQILFARHQGYQQRLFPQAWSPSVIHQVRDRRFEQSHFTQWTERDVPLFLGQSGPMIYSVEDALQQGGKPEVVSWTTQLYTCRKGVPVLGQQQAAGTEGGRPWCSFGEVVTSSQKGPWITVRLYGFEQGDNELEVRLITPYAGTDGVKGLHAVPEEKTRVLVGWSGRFGDSIFCLGNVRTEAVDLVSPSLELEKPLRLRLADVNIFSELKVRGYKQWALKVAATQVRIHRYFETGKA